jgi:hypothetical protein
MRYFFSSKSSLVQAWKIGRPRVALWTPPPHLSMLFVCLYPGTNLIDRVPNLTTSFLQGSIPPLSHTLKRSRIPNNESTKILKLEINSTVSGTLTPFVSFLLKGLGYYRVAHFCFDFLWMFLWRTWETLKRLKIDLEVSSRIQQCQHHRSLFKLAPCLVTLQCQQHAKSWLYNIKDTAEYCSAVPRTPLSSTQRCSGYWWNSVSQRIYLIPTLSNSESTRYRFYLIPSLSDAEPLYAELVRYQTIRYWTIR